MSYAIKMSDGRTVAGFRTANDAALWIHEQWPNAAIGHSGGLDDGGDRTLFWEDGNAAWNDDGRRALGAIVVL